jgi:dTDP-4-dehydrorhamnose 3,5-epimerase
MDFVCTKYSCKMINGVEFNNLDSHKDERGFFRELVKKNTSFANEGIAQVSHSLVYTSIIKAWHSHKLQTQWNYVLNGTIFVALHDLRNDSSTFRKTITFLAGENNAPLIYKFPPGVAHGYKCLSGPMNIIYFTSGQYDLNDEIRIPFDDKNINFDWLNITKIK